MYHFEERLKLGIFSLFGLNGSKQAHITHSSFKLSVHKKFDTFQKTKKWFKSHKFRKNSRINFVSILN